MECSVLALDDKEYEIKKGDIVVTNNNKVVCIAGVIGDASTMISEQTKNIALEAALFDGTTIMNSCKRYGLMTVAATNFSKNAVDRYNVLAAARMACQLLVEYADAKVVSKENAYDNRNLKSKEIVIDLAFINNRLGSSYSVEQIEEVLNRLSFTYKLDHETFDIIVLISTMNNIFCNSNLFQIFFA